MKNLHSKKKIKFPLLISLLQQWSYQIEYLIEEKKYWDAFLLCNKALSSYRSSNKKQTISKSCKNKRMLALIWFNYGFCSRYFCFDNQAIFCYKRAYSLNPNLCLSLLNLGQTFYDKGDLHISVTYMSQFLSKIERIPDDIRKQCELRACSIMGLSLYQLGNYLAAEPYYEKLYKQMSNDIEVSYMYQNLLEDISRELNPEILPLENLASKLHIREENPELALKYCDKALEIKPLSSILTLKGECLIQMGKYFEGWACIIRALSLNAQNIFARLLQSSIIAQLGHYDLAFEWLQETKELIPSKFHDQIVCLKGCIQLHFQKYEEAKATFSLWKDIQPELVKPVIMLATTNAFALNFAEAQDLFKIAISMAKKLSSEDELELARHHQQVCLEKELIYKNKGTLSSSEFCYSLRDESIYSWSLEEHYCRNQYITIKSLFDS